MRVTIIGGNGYVGSQLTHLLLEDHHEVTVLDKYTRTSHNVIPTKYLKAPPPVLDLTGDICNFFDVKLAIRDADIIVNLAAVVGTPACDEFPGEAFEVNIRGARVLNSCRRKDQPIIFASTGNVYGAVTDTVCTEKTPINPISKYAKTKAEAERYVLPNGVVLRFTTGFGVSPKMRYDSLINNWVDLTLKNKALNVYQPEAIRSFIDVYDMARAIHFMINSIKNVNGQIFNTGNDDLCITKKNIAEKIATFLPCDLTYTSGPTDQDARDYDNSFEKLTKVGFKPQMNLDRGIENLIERIKQGRY